MTDVTDDAGALHRLGARATRAGRPELAVRLICRALELEPWHLGAQLDLGNAVLALDRVADAIECYRGALTLEPRFAAAHVALGVALQRVGEPAEAVACFRRALELRPDYALAHENLGMSLLSLGDFAAGFAAYEWRRTAAPPAGPSPPRWDGGDLAGRIILLRAEQGLGDTLQFIRYARLVKARGAARVVVESQPELVRLLRTAPGVDAVVAAGDPPPPCDLEAPLLSLPHLCGAVIPADIPYLTPPPPLALGSGPGLRVGLVWAGAPRPDQPEAQAVDRRRSLPLARLAPLADVAGARFFSLQKGPAAAQRLNPPPGLELTDAMAAVEDFADTAAVVAGLDLVIGVDTAVCHLAGALGRPVWLLSRFDACWRWPLGRQDSPWYPSLRVVRQPAPGDWDTVVGRVVASLRQLRG